MIRMLVLVLFMIRDVFLGKGEGIMGILVGVLY